jgi:hypothetical protein
VYFATIPIARLDTRRLRIERLWKEDRQADS